MELTQLRLAPVSINALIFKQNSITNPKFSSVKVCLTISAFRLFVSLDHDLIRSWGPPRQSVNVRSADGGGALWAFRQHRCRCPLFPHPLHIMFVAQQVCPLWSLPHLLQTLLSRPWNRGAGVNCPCSTYGCRPHGVVDFSGPLLCSVAYHPARSPRRLPRLRYGLVPSGRLSGYRRCSRICRVPGLAIAHLSDGQTFHPLRHPAEFRLVLLSDFS
jgi:hypothetical protein